MSAAAYTYRLAVIGLFVAFVAGVGVSSQEPAISQPPNLPVAFKAAGAPTVEFSLPDMMCEDGCAWTVKDILSKQPGARDVRVDFEARKATVAIDDAKFDSQSALAELIDKGFMNSQVSGADIEVSATQLQSEAEEKNGAEKKEMPEKGA
jgi:copper chaperone CopZ